MDSRRGFEEGYFDWHVPVVHMCVCLTFLSGKQICRLVSGNFGGWLFCCRAAAMSVNQSMGPEGRDREGKSWQRNRTGERKAGHPRTGQERRRGSNIPSFVVTQSPLHSFFLAKSSTKLNRRDDRYFLSSLQFVYIRENKLWFIGTLYAVLTVVMVMTPWSVVHMFPFLKTKNFSVSFVFSCLFFTLLHLFEWDETRCFK